MNPTVFPLLIGGLLLLVAGAELFVRGAARIAALAGVEPLVIGLTVVAFGTSAPEVAVSLQAALAGRPDIALGNAVGSNITNILLILGLSAIIAPLAVSKRLIRLDVPVMIGVALLPLLFGLNGRLSRGEGFLLVLLSGGYTLFLILQGRRDTGPHDEFAQEYGPTAFVVRHWAGNLALVLGGLFLLVAGARWLVEGAVEIARTFGLSELVTGLTIVAVGTSLPELATSVIASLKGERDIAVGNIVGSNIFNILVVLGLAASVSPEGIAVSPAALHFDLPVMLAASLACLPIFFTGSAIARWEGFLFLGYYVAYTAYLLLASSSHAALPFFGKAMLLFVLPLTALTLLVVTWRSFRKMPS
jgi:cation:H+ antiporter